MSCASAASCVAVGDATTLTSASAATAQHWNANAWSGAETPDPNANERTLYAVSCPAANSCFAVGSELTAARVHQMLIEHWDGASWSVMTTPKLPHTEYSTLHGVSCVSTTRCYAAGAGPNPNGLVLKWDGTSWNTMKPPTRRASLPTRDLRRNLLRRRIELLAVGHRGQLNVATPVLERLVGTEWSFANGPSIDGTGGKYLTGISCATTTSCLAVGYVDQYRELGRTVALQLVGSTWSKLTSPNVAGFSSRLLGVSCPTATRCVAVGAIGPNNTPTRAIITTWQSGSSMRLTPSPNIAGSMSSALVSVSCSSLVAVLRRRKLANDHQPVHTDRAPRLKARA